VCLSFCICTAFSPGLPELARSVFFLVTYERQPCVQARVSLFVPNHNVFSGCLSTAVTKHLKIVHSCRIFALGREKKMSKYGTISYKVAARIGRKKCSVFLREDFADLGGYDQIGRALRNLARAGKLVKIGYGLYAKAKPSPLTGEIVPVAPLPVLAQEALERLGVLVGPSRLARAYNEGKTTQVPTGRLLAVKGRISRKIAYAGATIHYEPTS
jgi:hypothetical protein